MTQRSICLPKLTRAMVHAVLLSLSFSLQAHAADIANVPLPTQSSAAVRPNLLFILDDSGSMGWDYLPDTARYSNACFGYSQANLVFFDPNGTYNPPLKADGTPFPPANFKSAKDDGYAAAGTTSDLSNLSNLNTPSARIGTDNRGRAINSQFYYAIYKGTGTPNCGSGHDWTQWTLVTTLPSAMEQNYANWWSFYRTRMLMMRGAAGNVFNAIDASRFRVGYMAISNTQYTAGSTFLPVADFDSGTQKADFYSRVFGATPSGSTPLRPALERAGKYFAGRQLDNSALPSGAADPVRYSCQRNFTLLTTDGYWNKGNEPSGYIPRGLPDSAGTTTAIGNADGSAKGTQRPRLDDGRLVGGSWTTGGAGVSDTLADIAMYFFDTDLRDPSRSGTSCTVAGQNVCNNDVPYENVPNSGTEQVKHQRMTTYTLGMGVSGRLTYRADYDTATSGSFASIKSGALAWPNPDPSSTSSSVVERIDDLWHAAVNGRGRYYSAANPADLATGLGNALDTIASVTGTGAAAATSSQQPVSGDNFVYLGQYTTVLWQGNVKAFSIDVSTGAVSSTALWEAKNTLRAQVGTGSDTRRIVFRDPTVTGSKLGNFNYSSLSAAGLGGKFANLCQTGNFKLSQCAALVLAGGTSQADANDGNNVVNFLRGQYGKEDLTANATNDRLFRARPNTPLGDLVNAAPVYVKKPPFRYGDAGYVTFAANNANRTGVVYVAANDGMLHALNATTGVEMWAYVPTAVMDNMPRLADANYDVNHRYFVDATPVVGDVYDGTNWRTILVGGLGAGGRAYYALDITDPANPKSLWEFSVNDDADLGLSYGNPVITKNKAGAWVVAFGSGYSNVLPGDGNGHLYVRDAITGTAIDKIHTYTSGALPAGTAVAPSEMAKINAWIDTETDNTAKRIYGGDMLGYVWRFDFDDNIAPSGKEAMLLGRALAPGNVPQPITTKPVLTKVGSTMAPTVTVATGRYLGVTDLSDFTRQSIYVFKDPLTATGLGTLRSNAGMVQQTMASWTVNGTATRGVTPNPVNWSTDTGWYVDLSLSARERVNVEMLQTGRLLAVASNIPVATACNPGGTSWLYFFDIQTGALGEAPAADGTGGKAGAVEGDQLLVGLNIVKVGDVIKVIAWDATGKPTVETPPVYGSGGPVLRRSSWRELIN